MDMNIAIIVKDQEFIQTIIRVQENSANAARDIKI